MAKHSLPVIYLNEAIRRAPLAETDIAALLWQAGLSRLQLQDPKALISEEQYITITLGLMRRCRDELIGVGGPRPVPLGSFGMMCHAVIHLPTLRKALLRASLFYKRLLDNVAFKLTVQGDRAAITVHWKHPEVDPEHVSTEALLAIAHRLACWLTDQRIPLQEASFAYARPDRLEYYQRLFRCPLKFNQARNSVVFAARYLNYPLLRDDADLRRFLRAVPAHLLVLPSNMDLLEVRVRSLLGRDFTRHLPDFDTVADRLNLTPQTLRRRLRDEGTSYQAIKDELRRDTAIQQLGQPQCDLGEIVRLTGFSEPSTFHRAFKKWTGMTPNEYRRSLNL